MLKSNLPAQEISCALQALTWATLTTMSAMEVAFCRMIVALLFMAFTIWSVLLRVS